MTRTPRVDPGDSPETVAWKAMVKWVKDHNINQLALALNVPVSMVHGWVWRDSRPGTKMRPLVAAFLGCKASDWESKEERAAVAKIVKAAKSRAA